MNWERHPRSYITHLGAPCGVEEEVYIASAAYRQPRDNLEDVGTAEREGRSAQSLS